MHSFKMLFCSMTAALALAVALPGAALAADAGAETEVGAETGTGEAVEDPMGYAECLSAIEAAAAAHEPRVEFEGGVSREVYNQVVTALFWPSELGRVSHEKCDAMLICDRYAIKNIQGYALPCHSEYPVIAADISYYFTAAEVAKADKIVAKVAKKAKAVKGRGERIKYIHNWVVRNAAYTGHKSPVWKKSSAYGVPASKVNHGGSTAQLLSHRGRCYSYTMTFLRICEAAGIEDVTYVACKAKSRGTWEGHAIAAVKDKAGAEGKWRYIDVTWDDPLYRTASGKVSEYDRVTHKYYMRTRSYMLRNLHRF